MTVATLAWGLLRLYMPRDAVAKAIAADIVRAYVAGDDYVKDAVKTLLGEKDPMSANGQALLAGFSAKAATGLLLGLLSSDQVKASLLYKSGYLDITDDTDKQRVLAAYEQFLGILQNADYSTQASLDKALEAADEALVRSHRHAHLLQPDDQGADARQEHGDEICRAPLLRHVGAAAVPRRDRLPSLRCNRDACQREEDGGFLAGFNAMNRRSFILIAAAALSAAYARGASAEDNYGRFIGSSSPNSAVTGAR